MKTPRAILSSALALTTLFAAPAQAYLVYLHTGHGPIEVNDLWKKSSFPIVEDRDEKHGVWAFGLSFAPMDQGQREKTVKNVGPKRSTVYESGPYMKHDKPMSWMAEGKPSPQMKQYWNWGFENPKFILFYREHSTNPGIETYIRPEDVEGLKAGIAAIDDRKQRRAVQEAKWLTLMRRWDPALKDSIALDEVGGVVAEFGIPVAGPQLIENNLVPAIEYTLRKGKSFFLLTPPLNNADSSVKDYYVDGYQAMVKELKRHLSRKNFNSDNLVFVPANYAYGKDGKNVEVTPETDPNTVTGVNKWLIEEKKD